MAVYRLRSHVRLACHQAELFFLVRQPAEKPDQIVVGREPSNSPRMICTGQRIFAGSMIGRCAELRLPAIAPGFDIMRAPGLLEELLLEGELDGLIDIQPPRCFVEGHPAVARLFADHEAAERAYFARTGIFPIMHVLCLRRDSAERAPGVAESLYRAFSAAKDLAVSRLCSPGALKVSLPWVSEEYRRTVALMGPQIWPYGVRANRAAIESIPRYAQAQGLASRRPGMDELFAACLLST